jgi:hypothetical protein
VLSLSAQTRKVKYTHKMGWETQRLNNLTIEHPISSRGMFTIMLATFKRSGI